MWRFFGSQHPDVAVVDYLSPSLYQSVRPWLSLLEMYRTTDRRAEFSVLANRLQDDFNLSHIAWQTSKDRGAEVCTPLEAFPHIVEWLAAMWGRPESLEYVHALLQDNRAGRRSGFPLAAFEELLMLASLLEEQFGKTDNFLSGYPSTPSSSQLSQPFGGNRLHFV